MDLKIELSQAAAREIVRMQKTRNKPESRLRIQVKQGGCSGLFYCLDLENSLAENNSQSKDLQFNSQGIAIVVDPLSYNYLQGIKLDYAEDLMGGGFRFQNPNAFNACGCGISFTVKQKIEP